MRKLKPGWHAYQKLKQVHHMKRLQVSAVKAMLNRNSYVLTEHWKDEDIEGDPMMLALKDAGFPPWADWEFLPGNRKVIDTYGYIRRRLGFYERYTHGFLDGFEVRGYKGCFNDVMADTGWLDGWKIRFWLETGIELS